MEPCIFKCQTLLSPQQSQLMDGHHQFPKYITTDNGKAIQTNKHVPKIISLITI